MITNYVNSKTALTITVDETKISNPDTVKAYRVGNFVVVSLWGTKFNALGQVSDIITGAPSTLVPCSAYLALGASNAYNIQGNLYISGAHINCGIRGDYVIGTSVYGSLIYPASN